jgi:hypothetical protein
MYRPVHYKIKYNPPVFKSTEPEEATTPESVETKSEPSSLPSTPPTAQPFQQVKKSKPKKVKTGLGVKIENTLIQKVEDVPKNVRQTEPPPAPLIAKFVDKKKPRKADASVASSETESQPP